MLPVAVNDVSEFRDSAPPYPTSARVTVMTLDVSVEATLSVPPVAARMVPHALRDNVFLNPYNDPSVPHVNVPPIAVSDEDPGMSHCTIPVPTTWMFSPITPVDIPSPVSMRVAPPGEEIFPVRVPVPLAKLLTDDPVGITRVPVPLPTR
jgi:hypothetical protein